MYRLARWLLLIGLVLGVSNARAAAWVETVVSSDAVTITLDRDGRATISHAIVMKIRGGPLKSFTLQGVDGDAEPLPEAHVVNTSLDSTASRKDLTLARGDDQSLQIDVADDKGLRQGTYLFEFSYRTDFRVSQMLRPRNSGVEIGWVGSRFPNGLDGAKVTFRVPTSSVPPRLAQSETDPNDTLGAPVDSFVSQMRRSGPFDELELMRAHVAQGEPVLWRIWVSEQSLNPSAIPHNPTQLDAASSAATSLTIAADRLSGIGWLMIAVGLAAAWAVVKMARLRCYARDCVNQGVTPQALVKVHPVLRIVASAASVSVATVCAWYWQCPNAAAVAVVAAMVLSVHRHPHQENSLRGPGSWLPLTDSEAFSREKPRLAGRFFDVCSWQGKLVLAGYVLVVAVAAMVLSRQSPYDAALLVMMAPLPLPLFLTALSSQFPQAERDRKRRWLSACQKRLAKSPQVKVIAWARFPDGEAQPDELRLRIVPPLTVDGLVSIEVAHHEEATERLPTVGLLIRVREGSLAQRVWQDRLVWQRGRRADERVAVHKLRWPMIGLMQEAVDDLLTDLGRQRPVDAVNPLSRSKATKSSASAAVQSNAGTGAAPAHEIRRA